MLKIEGIVKGVKTETISETGGKPDFEKHYIGIEMPKPNGFDGETIVEKIQISRDQFNRGVYQKYGELKGQRVEAPVFVNAFQTRNGAGYQLFLSGDGLPRVVGK